jgi:hypothetical protein
MKDSNFRNTNTAYYSLLSSTSFSSEKINLQKTSEEAGNNKLIEI